MHCLPQAGGVLDQDWYHAKFFEIAQNIVNEYREKQAEQKAKEAEAKAARH